MLELVEIRRHLQYMVLSRVSDETGIDRSRLARIRDGVDTDPKMGVAIALSNFIVGLRHDE